jgi:iron complex outermembrane receptor protein
VTGQRNFSSVATYFAEVPTNIAGPGVFFDLTNVQVLKGPQGTLFGRNTTGGAVLFEPAAPTWANEGYAQVQFGNYAFKQFNGVLNVVPVPDKVALRLAAEITRRDGFTQSIVTGQKLDNRHYEGIRFSLRLTPTDGIENTTIVSYRNRDQAGTSQVLAAFYPQAQLGTVGGTASLAGLYTAFGGQAGIGLSQAQFNSIPLTVGGVVTTGCLSAATAPTACPVTGRGIFQTAFNNGGLSTNFFNSQLNSALATQQAIGPRKNQQASLAVDKQLDWSVVNRTKIAITDNVSLKNIISYQKSRQQFAFDYDGTPLNFLEQRTSPNEWSTGSEQFTEEVQLQGTVPSLHLDYLAGFYYEKEKPGFLMQTLGYTLGRGAYRFFDHDDDSKAVFGHLEWNPAPFIGVSGGIRQTWDGRKSSISLTDLNNVCTQINPATGTVGCPIEYTGKFSATTYDATLTLKPMRELLGYVSYRRGYKSGGFNLPAPVAPGPDPTAFQRFNPEYVKEIEVGIKGDFTVGTVPVRFDAAYFHDDYENIQVSQSVVLQTANGPQGSVIILNSAAAKNQGAEFQGTILPFKNLSLSGFFSYIDAHFSTTVPGATTAGRQLRNTPKYKFGFSGSYTLPLEEKIGKITLFADYSHQSSAFFDNRGGGPANGGAIIESIPGYGLLNGRIAWDRVMDSNLDIAAFATNITNKTYVVGGYPITSLGMQAFVYGEPRMYGASLKYHF